MSVIPKRVNPKAKQLIWLVFHIPQVATDLRLVARLGDGSAKLSLTSLLDPKKSQK